MVFLFSHSLFSKAALNVNKPIRGLSSAVLIQPQFAAAKPLESKLKENVAASASGVALKQAGMAACQIQEPTGGVLVSPSLAKVFGQWRDWTGPQTRPEFSMALKTLSWALDAGANTDEAMASLFLSQAANAQDPKVFLKLLKQQVPDLPVNALKLLERTAEILPTGYRPLAALSKPEFRSLQSAPLQIKRLILAQALAALDVASVSGPAESPIIGKNQVQAARDLIKTMKPTGLKDPIWPLIRLFEQVSKQFYEVNTSALPESKPTGDPLEVDQTFDEAMAYAITLHQKQWRRDNKAPYVAHLFHVAASVIEMGGSQSGAIAALLHDGPEDQGEAKTLAEIQKRFGPEVAQMVSECTIIWEKDWLKERQAYLRQISPSAHPETLKIMLGDKLHNLQGTVRTLAAKGPDHWKSFARTPEMQLWYYRSVKSAMSFLNMPKTHLNRLETLIHEAERLTYSKEHPLYRLLFPSWRVAEERSTMQKMLGEAASNPKIKTLNTLTNSLPSTMPTGYRLIDGKKVPDFPPERAQQHTRMLESLYQSFLTQREKLSDTDKAQEKGYKVAHIVTGPFGAGKSCYIALPLAEQDCALVVDADVFKKQFPEYNVKPEVAEAMGVSIKPNNGLGAGAVHQESSYLVNQLLDQAIENRDSFVVSYTGRDLDWDKKMIQDLKGKGYKVYVHHLQASLDTAVKRMFHRYETEGRYTPPDILIRASKNSTDNFIQLKDWGFGSGLIDGYSWYFNDIEEGSPPVLVESLHREPEPFLPHAVHSSCVLSGACKT
jgi:predicted ABC-type ATPase